MATYIYETEELKKRFSVYNRIGYTTSVIISGGVGVGKTTLGLLTLAAAHNHALEVIRGSKDAVIRDVYSEGFTKADLQDVTLRHACTDWMRFDEDSVTEFLYPEYSQIHYYFLDGIDRLLAKTQRLIAQVIKNHSVDNIKETKNPYLFIFTAIDMNKIVPELRLICEHAGLRGLTVPQAVSYFRLKLTELGVELDDEVIKNSVLSTLEKGTDRVNMWQVKHVFNRLITGFLIKAGAK